MMPASSALRQRLLREIAALPEGVRAHIEAVRRTSVDLAGRHGADVARAELAALAHDVCRLVKAPQLLEMARAFGIPVTPIDAAFPVFLHGPVGAELLRRDYGLDDEAVLSPVRCHTMGRRSMTALDQVLFLADKLDPSKLNRYPFMQEVARLAAEDLDRAMRCFIDSQVRAFIDHGDLVHPEMMAARNDAILALKAPSTG